MLLMEKWTGLIMVAMSLNSQRLSFSKSLQSTQLNQGAKAVLKKVRLHYTWFNEAIYHDKSFTAVIKPKETPHNILKGTIRTSSTNTPQE